MNRHDLHDDDVLQELFSPWRNANRWLVGFSGGMDSSVLLHLCARVSKLWRDNGEPSPAVEALHLDHGLSASHRDWARHCKAQCDALDVPFHIESIRVVKNGNGLEEAARLARYAVFEKYLEPGDVLMLGHHQRDQGETLLYRLMRGTGIAGAASIPVERKLGKGSLARPMLPLPRSAIAEYARQCAIEYIDDESNVDTRFDRNFLRNEVIPLLEKRWPAASRSLARFAGHAREQGMLADDMASIDLDSVLQRDKNFGNSLSLDALNALSEHRRYNLYNYCLARLGVDPPGRVRIEEIDNLVVNAQAGKQLDFVWLTLRLHQGALYFIKEQALHDLPRQRNPIRWQPDADWPLSGSLRCEQASGSGLRKQAYWLGHRLPQAEARLNGVGKPLKKLFQELAVPAWLRDVAPVLYAGDSDAYDRQVAAIPGFVVCDDFSEEQGWLLQWRCTEFNALQVLDHVP